MPSVVHALDINETVFPPAGYFVDFAKLINSLLSNLILLAAIILFLLVIVAGFQMIQAAGNSDPKALEKWRKTLTFGAVGFVLILASYVIMLFIQKITGITILDIDF